MSSNELRTAGIPGFTYGRERVEGVAINYATAGQGSPLLLLHGYPQTHLMWRHLAPVLAEQHTVVAADLRGYGDSDKPEPVDDLVYSKQQMAADQVGLMAQLGFDRFDLISHDRGSRVSHRLVLDHPEAVSSLTVMDIVPTLHAMEHVDMTMAAAYFHWFFLPAGGGVPERLIGADPAFWLRSVMGRLQGGGDSIEGQTMDEYVRCFSSPGAVAASCADYRASTGADLVHDRQSRELGRRIDCPTLALWGSRSFVGKAYSPLDAWSTYANNLSGTSVDCGHFMAEEAAAEVTTLVREFLDGLHH